MYRRWLIIPRNLRQSISERLHSAHQCPVKKNDKAKDTAYLPGFTLDIEDTRISCTYCKKDSLSQLMMPPSPLVSPEFPYQMVGADYFTGKWKTWLAVAKRFSRWFSLFQHSKEASVCLQ